jgi:hypothetical protein
LNGSLDNDDYMRIPEGFSFCETYKLDYWRDDLINMNKSPYILEQYICMLVWYSCWIFSNKKYENDNLFIFKKIFGKEFVIF